MLSRLRRPRDERGAIILLTSVGIVVAMVAGGLAVDAGVLAVETRNDQRVADLAALDGVRALPTDPTDAVRKSAARNKFPYNKPGYQLLALWNDPATGIFGTDPTKLPVANQVRVIARSPHQKVFVMSTTAGSGVDRKATATIGNPPPCPPLPYVCVKSDGNPIGTVRVGSSAATLNSSDSVILNRLLTNTVGGSYSTSAVGWQGLASGNVKFSRLRTALGYSAGTTDQVLDASLKYRQLLDATVSALNAEGGSSATVASTLATIAAQVTSTAGANLTLRRLLDVVGNVGGGADVADAAINVKDIVVGGMALADSDHFATFNLTAADIPGLPGTSVTVKFGLIESPREKSGAPGKDAAGVYRTTARTAQIRLEALVALPVTLVGLGVINLTVPYYLYGAEASASLDSMVCAAGDDVPTSVKIFGSTSLARTYIGSVSDANLSNSSTIPLPTTATLGTLAVPLVATVTVSLNNVVYTNAEIPGHSGFVTFTPPYTGTTSQPIPGSTTLQAPTTANADLKVTVTAGLLPLGVSVTTIQNNLVAAINPTSTTLNSVLFVPLQRALGVTLAAGDVWAPPAQHCNPVSYNLTGPSTPVPQVPTLIA